MSAKVCMICGDRGAYGDSAKGFGLIILCLDHYKEYWVNCKKPTKCKKCGYNFIALAFWQTSCYPCFLEEQEDKNE